MLLRCHWWHRMSQWRHTIPRHDDVTSIPTSLWRHQFTETDATTSENHHPSRGHIETCITRISVVVQNASNGVIADHAKLFRRKWYACCQTNTGFTFCGIKSCWEVAQLCKGKPCVYCQPSAVSRSSWHKAQVSSKAAAQTECDWACGAPRNRDRAAAHTDRLRQWWIGLHG